MEKVMITRFLIAVFTIFIFGACASTVKSGPSIADNNLPTWVNDSSKDYPGMRYLTAVGSGSSLETAKNNARTNISKIFSTKIESNDVISSTFKKIDGNQQSDLRFKSMARLSTNSLLMGVKIEKTHEDKSGNFYSLAVLDRDRGAELVKSKMNEISEKIRADYETTKAGCSPEIKCLLVLNSAKRKFVEWQLYNSQYKVLVTVDPNSPKLPVSLSKLDQDINAIKAKGLDFSVEIDGSGSEQLAPEVTKILGENGLQVSQSENSPYQLKGALMIEPLDHPDKRWVYMKWMVELKGLEKSNSRVIFSMTFLGKSAQRTDSLAVEKSIRDIVRKIKAELPKELSKL